MVLRDSLGLGGDGLVKHMKEVALWLVYDAGYPFDFQINQPCPPVLWEAIIDVVHEDQDGTLHGNELTRDEVENWLVDP